MNKQKAIRELKFWNTLCGCVLIAGFIISMIAQLEYKNLVSSPSSPLFWAFNIPMLMGLLFIIPLHMSSNALNEIDD